MRFKLLQSGKEKTYAVIFDKGDEFTSRLTQFAAENKLGASHFTAIGAFRDVILGYFDRQSLQYQKIPVQEQVEVLSLIGDIALEEGQPKVHAHAVLGRSDASTCGGHLLEAHVWPTLEVMVVESPEHLQRKMDAATGLALIQV